MKELSLLFWIGIVMFAGMGLTVYFHELAHTKINTYNGLESHMEFSLMGGTTYTDSNYVSTEQFYFTKLGHGINEAIGYQIQPMILMLCGIIGACTFYLGGKLDKIQVNK